MGFWKITFYNTSILIITVVILTLCISQAIMIMLFNIQSNEVAVAIPLLITQIIVFSIEFLYIISVMLFLANQTKIAKIIAILTITLHLSYRFFNMFIEYSNNKNPMHIANMAMIIFGLIALLVYIRLSKYKKNAK